VGPSRGALLRRLAPVRAPGLGLGMDLGTMPGLEPAALGEGLLAALDERAIWARFGL